MSQPSLDISRSSLLLQHQLQMPLPASGHVISIFFLFLECDMLTSASILLLIFIVSKVVSFIPFRAAQSSQVLPPSSNSPWWPLSHAGSSSLNFNTSVSLHHRVQQHSMHLLALIFFLKASKLRSFKLNHGGND